MTTHEQYIQLVQRIAVETVRQDTYDAIALTLMKIELQLAKLVQKYDK